jgi:hypothetical protein
MCNVRFNHLNLDLLENYLYKNDIKMIQKYLEDNIHPEPINSIIIDYIKNIINEKHKNKKPKIYIYTSGLGNYDNYRLWANIIYPDLLKYNHEFCIIHFDEKLKNKYVFDNQLVINMNINFNKNYPGKSNYLTFDNLPGVYNKKYLYFDFSKIQNDQFYNVVRIYI